MKVTTSLSKKRDKYTQQSEILLRLIVGKINDKAVTFRAKSRIYVNPDRWDAKKGKIQTDIRTTRVRAKTELDAIQAEKEFEALYKFLDKVTPKFIKNKKK